MWFIGVEVEQETSAPRPKKNPGPAPVKGGQLMKEKSGSQVLDTVNSTLTQV